MPPLLATVKQLVIPTATPRSVPSILEQTKWPIGFYTFPDCTPHNEYFNPTVVRWRGGVWLFVRRRFGPVGLPGRNTIEAWFLKHNHLKERFNVEIPAMFTGEHWEDPRALVRNGTVLLSYCNFDQTSHAHQCITGLQPTYNYFTAEPPLHVVYGNNGPHLHSNKGHEKNWTWFVHHDGHLWFSYSLGGGTHTVCKTGGGVVQQVHKGWCPTWQFGELRGGTPPIRVGEHYWTFFHSSNDWVKPRRRYHMGALAFSATPPFNITRFTPKPLLSGSELDYRHPHNPPCVFPGGALFEDDSWFVVGGCNDNKCFWMRIPHKELLRRAKPTLYA